MARLTDEELERLLRETFADKEDQVDSLPLATERRRPLAPVLVAAAAVVVVLGSILYGVSRGRDVDPAPLPVATAGVSEDADIWAAAITAITQRADRAAGVQTLQTVLVMDGTATLVESAQAGNSRVFSAAEKDRIADLVAKATRVQVKWPEGSLLPHTAQCAPTVARVSVGEVVDKGDHKEVRTGISNCAYSALTYRVEKRGDSWTVTGTVGVAEGATPVACPLSATTPAIARDGC
jgi:hypothetical protein